MVEISTNLHLKRNLKVPIVFCVDDTMGAQLSVTIQSIIENAHANNLYQIYVFDLGIKKQTISKLKKQVNRVKNFFIEFINIDKNVQEHIKIFSQSLTDIPHITKATYGRFFYS